MPNHFSPDVLEKPVTRLSQAHKLIAFTRAAEPSGQPPMEGFATTHPGLQGMGSWWATGGTGNWPIRMRAYQFCDVFRLRNWGWCLANHFFDLQVSYIFYCWFYGFLRTYKRPFGKAENLGPFFLLWEMDPTLPVAFGEVLQCCPDPQIRPSPRVVAEMCRSTTYSFLHLGHLSNRIYFEFNLIKSYVCT